MVASLESKTMTTKDITTPDHKTETSAEAEARQRATDCWTEIEKVLEKHRCQIVPYLRSLDPVVPTGVKPEFGVIPKVEETDGNS